MTQIIALFSGALILFTGIIVGYAFGVRSVVPPPEDDE